MGSQIPSNTCSTLGDLTVGGTTDSLKKATIVNWVIMGVYFTTEFLQKMKKVKSPLCLGCPNQINETLNHILLHCGYYKIIHQAKLSTWRNLIE